MKEETMQQDQDEVQRLIDLAKRIKKERGCEQGGCWISLGWWHVTSKQRSCLGDPDGFEVSASLTAPNGEDPAKRYQEYLGLCDPAVLVPLLEELSSYRARSASEVLVPFINELDVFKAKVEALSKNWTPRDT